MFPFSLVRRKSKDQKQSRSRTFEPLERREMMAADVMSPPQCHEDSLPVVVRTQFEQVAVRADIPVALVEQSTVQRASLPAIVDQVDVENHQRIRDLAFAEFQPTICPYFNDLEILDLISAKESGHLSLGGFSLTNVTMEEIENGFNVKGTLNAPGVKDVKLTGFVSKDFQHYNLNSDSATVTIGGVKLTDAVTTLDEEGVTVKGKWSHSLLGSVTFTGKLTEDGYRLVADTPAQSLFKGAVTLEAGELELTPDGITFSAQVNVKNMGKFPIGGKVAEDGGYEFGGTSGFKMGELQIDGAKVKLGDKSLDVEFTMPVEGVGNVEFKGNYGPDGEWLIQGKYPGPITIGPVVLDNLELTVTDKFIEGTCIGSIADMKNVVNVHMSTTFWYDGRIEIETDARLFEIGKYSVGRSILTVGNKDEHGKYEVTLESTVGFDGVEITFTGEFDEYGNYTLKGKAPVEIAGVELQRVDFTLTKEQGLTISSTNHVLGSGVCWTGKVDENGRLAFTGEGSMTVGKLSLGKASFALENDVLTITTSVLRKKVTLTGKLNPDGTYLLEGDATIDFGSLTKQKTHFVLENDRVTVTATVKILAKTLTFNGELDDQGGYSVTVNKNLTIAGVSLSSAKFTLSKSDGLSFEADVDHFGYSFGVDGRVKSGVVTFDGSVKLAFGSKVEIKATLRPSEADIEVEVTGLGKLSAGKIADVLKKLSDKVLNVVMDSLPVEQLSAALENFGGTTLRDTLSYLDPSRAAEVLSNFSSSDTLQSALDGMSVKRLSSLLPNFTANNLRAVLRRLDVPTIAGVLNRVEVETLEASLKRLDPSVAADVVKNLDKDVAKVASDFFKKLDPKKFSDAINEAGEKISGGLRKLDPSSWRR